jgi:Mce-associated membrane protein
LAGKRLAITIALAAVLFVGSAAFAGAMVQPYLADRATSETKLKVARTAAEAVTTLWTYTPENMDGLADRAADHLSGDFGAQYRKFLDAIVGPNKQAKVTNRTDVTGAAVESLDGPNAVVIVYTNTTSTSPLTKNIPSLKYLSYRLFMKHTQSRWLVTRMTTITSLDLTPRV